MKRIISILLTITLLFCVTVSIQLNVSAVTTDKIESGETYTNKYGSWTYELTASGDGYVITGYNGNATDVEIPNSIDGIPVLEIGDNAFFDCSSLMNSITIPESVTTIGETSFAVGENFTDIYVSANNKNYSSVDGVLFDKTQSNLICYPCGKLSENYIIPDSVTIIGEKAFGACFNLTNIAISDNVTTIGEGAFAQCSSLNNITIPDSVITIGNFAFFNCSSLTNVTISDSVTTIGGGAFSDCSSLTDITIPDSVISIEDSTFSNCSSLTGITIPDSVTSIGIGAFDNCNSLTNIIIPDSVTSIYFYAFDGCSSLNDVYYTGNENQWNSITISDYNSELTSATIHFNYVEPIAGDTSGDGVIAINDVLLILKYIVGDMELTEQQFANADLNGDGELTVVDVIMLQKIILKA